MNGKRVMMLTLAAILPVIVGQAAGQEGIESLRGMTPIENPSPAPQNPLGKTDRTAVPRNFAQQPPLIPHPTKAYQINLKQNKCLSCHGAAEVEESGAPGVSQTHYLDRDGNTQAEVSGSRYFCTQCHVEQFVAEPLVENDFKPDDAQK